MRLSFCSASVLKTGPRWRRNSPYRILRLHFGMNTTWYLHSHFVWLRLWYSSMRNSLSRSRGRLTEGSLRFEKIPEM